MNRRLIAASLCLVALASLEGCNRRRRRNQDDDDNSQQQPARRSRNDAARNDAARNATRNATRHAAWDDAARNDAAWDAAWYAAPDATRHAAGRSRNVQLDAAHHAHDAHAAHAAYEPRAGTDRGHARSRRDGRGNVAAGRHHAAGRISLVSAYLGIMLTAGVPVTIVVRGGPRTDVPNEMLDTYAILIS